MRKGCKKKRRTQRKENFFQQAKMGKKGNCKWNQQKLFVQGCYRKPKKRTRQERKKDPKRD